MSTNSYLLPHSYPSKGPDTTNWPAHFQIWLPATLFTLIIAVESQSIFGANHTSAPLHTLFQSLFGSSVNQHWTGLHHILRKTGHFLGFAAFSLVCLRGLRQTMQDRVSPLTLHAIAVACTFLIASADELHQHYLPNRTGTFHDVLLDTAGAITTQLVIHFISKF